MSDQTQAPPHTDIDPQSSSDDWTILTIGIQGTGPGSGKDAAAKIIASLLGQRGIRTSIQKFATALRQQVELETSVPVAISETTEGKNILVNKFTIEGNHVGTLAYALQQDVKYPIRVDGEAYKTTITLAGPGITVGRYLQILGSLMKNVSENPNYWVDRLFSNFSQGEVVIISDVRFPLEQQAVAKRAGVTILIKRSRETDQKEMAGRDVSHESERALDGIQADYTIENDGTIDDLRNKLEKLISHLASRSHSRPIEDSH